MTIRRIVVALAEGIAVLVAAAIVLPSLAAPDRQPVERTRGGAGGKRPAAVDGARIDSRGGCQRWVSPSGDDRDGGSRGAPWATLEHAVEAVPDRGCTVWFESGTYPGMHEIERGFRKRTVFRAVEPYRAVFQNRSTILDVGDNASRMTFRGFRFRQTRGASDVAVYVSGGDAPRPAPSHLSFVDNVFHDSFDEDLMKIRSRARAIRVRGNVFYNQGSNEQHIDVNSVTNVVIEDNIFFNDFEASGRDDDGSTKHFIVVKDSNENADRLRGSKRITIRRNVFLSWQGDEESFIGVGNDGKPYHEAQNVRIENNLFIGNGSDAMNAPLTVYGARALTFANNTVVGDLPSDAFAFEVDIKARNPRNDGIWFRNNIWSDVTGTMSQFSDGDRADTSDLVLDNNLYWNDGRTISSGDVVSPLRDDARLVVQDPGLSAEQGSIVLPVWAGTRFRSGEASVRAEFARLVHAYGSLPADSSAVGRALTSAAPRDDILGRTRDGEPDLGAFEAAGAEDLP